ncbi:MAG: NACHT domain-containing protein [Candidatus Aminicenantes bacterium]|nr:NACHT domain-containing protein [Candidatus Aminicenantes bacterium]
MNISAFVLGIFSSVIGTLIYARFGLFLKILRKIGLGSCGCLQRWSKVKTGLDTYLKNLADKILCIPHPLIKEGQYLTDILVPIYFKVNHMAQREELETYLAREYRKNPALRLVITGKPGSGKTIAMRVMARALSSFDTETHPVPILLAFTDIKGLDDSLRLEQTIIEKLKFFQFEQGEKNNIAERFVKENLYTGKLFLLFDGFDELDKANRETAAKFLNTFLGMYPRVPAAISSRTAVYESEPAFDHLKPCKISMAPFTPFAVLKFLSLWKFEGPKSARALFEMINGKAHLAEMASNPLMLTIITFLYSLSNYTLPDNRVEFYEQCTRALLEEWDRIQLNNRPNKFESHQKIAVLNRLAFHHIGARGSDDESISEEVIHEISRVEMARLSLKPEEYPLLEKEIVRNSGLLESIPPAEYRFSHRTFMEFFAASYLDKDKEKSAQDILDLYDSDPKKWKEVVLLYLGLNKNPDYADVILKRLIQDFAKTLETGAAPDFILFSALTQCATPDPHTAADILNLARQYLITRGKPVKEVVEELGYIAANPRAYAAQAKDLLLDLLKQKLPDPVFQQVIFSLLHAGDKTLDAVIFNNLKRINLVEFLARLGLQEKHFFHQLFAMDIPTEEKEKIIEGLKEAGNQELLGYLLIENPEETIRERAAYALWRMSKLDGFYAFLDHTETGLLAENTKKEIDARFNRWRWRWNKPGTVSGKKFAHLICTYAAAWIAKSRDKLDEKVLAQVDNRFRYLATGFLVEKGKPFSTFNLIGLDNNITASTRGLKKYWRKTVDLNRFCYKAFENFGPLVLIFISLIYLAINIIGIIGFILYLLGWFSANVFFFDPFTVQVVFYQCVLYYVLLFFFFFPINEGDSKYLLARVS